MSTHAEKSKKKMWIILFACGVEIIIRGLGQIMKCVAHFHVQLLF